MNIDRLLDEANAAFQKGDAGAALAMLARLPGKEEDGRIILLEGLIHEFGGRDLRVDLERALRNYRRVNLIAPRVALPCLCIARVLMKSPGSDTASIRRWLDEARRIRHDADVDLAFAAFYEEGPHVDLDTALAYFRRAAVAGRYAGFFGVSRILRKKDKRVLATAVDCVRVLLAPVLLLLFGSRVTASFNGYWR